VARRVPRRGRSTIAHSAAAAILACTTIALLAGEVGGRAGAVQLEPPYDSTRPARAATGTWQAASIGDYHTVALTGDGSLWAWGLNDAGQLGIGSFPGESVPAQVGSSTWRSAVAGGRFTVGIASDATLWAWGANDYGQLGDRSMTARLEPMQISTSPWRLVTAGDEHTLAIRGDDTLWAWGANEAGQLGDGTTTDRLRRTRVGSSTWRTVRTKGSRHDGHTVAIRGDGTLWAWGGNGRGQLGDGTTTGRKVPVRISASSWLQVTTGPSMSLGVRADGSLWAWGTNHDGLGTGGPVRSLRPARVAGSWQRVDAGLSHVLAVRGDGTLWTWGNNLVGQLGDRTTVDRPTPVRISTSSWHLVDAEGVSSIAIRGDDTLWAWGDPPWSLED